MKKPNLTLSFKKLSMTTCKYCSVAIDKRSKACNKAEQIKERRYVPGWCWFYCYAFLDEVEGCLSALEQRFKVTPSPQMS